MSRRAAVRLGDALPPLLVAAWRIAETVHVGPHGRRRGGPGDTFWEYRPYRPTEPAARIDWRRSARSDDLYLRETEWQAAQTLLLWRDASPSMAYRSRRDLPAKRERAEVLLLALAVLAARGGERVGLPGGPPRMGGARHVLEAVALDLDTVPADRWPSPPRHARVVLLGDFLDPPGRLADLLGRLRAGGATGHLVGLRDPAEDALPFAGRVRVEGMEGEGGRRIERIEDLRAGYRRAVARQRAEVADLARRFGCDLIWHRTDAPPEPVLLSLYERLSEVPC